MGTNLSEDRMIEVINYVATNKDKYFGCDDALLKKMEGITSMLVDGGYLLRFEVNGNVVSGYGLRTPYLDVYSPATGGCWYNLIEGKSTVIIAAVLNGKREDIYIPLEDTLNITVYKDKLLIIPFSSIVLNNFAEQYMSLFHPVEEPKLAVVTNTVDEVEQSNPEVSDSKVTQLFPTKGK